MSIEKIEKNIQEILTILKETRKERGFSQREVAEFLNISQNAYKDIETGKTELKVKTLSQLNEFLGLDIEKTRGTDEISKEEATIIVKEGDVLELIKKVEHLNHVVEGMQKQLNALESLELIVQLAKQQK